MTFREIRVTAVLAVLAIAAGCATVKVEPVEVKPIHLTLDVNIRVQDELADAFAFEDEVLEESASDSTETDPSAPDEGADDSTNP